MNPTNQPTNTSGMKVAQDSHPKGDPKQVQKVHGKVKAAQDQHNCPDCGKTPPGQC